MSIRFRSLTNSVRHCVWSDAETGRLLAELVWGESVPVAIVFQPEGGFKLLQRASYHGLMADVRHALELQGNLQPGEEFAE
jgi:hypothetical protein